jgi:hypothetical protein
MSICSSVAVTAILPLHAGGDVDGPELRADAALRSRSMSVWIFGCGFRDVELRDVALGTFSRTAHG